MHIKSLPGYYKIGSNEFWMKTQGTSWIPRGYSTTDHLHALNQLIEKANEYQLNLCVGYMDYEIAFNSVEHADLFIALRKTGVNETYVKIIEDIYTNAVAIIHLDNDVSNQSTSIEV